MGMCVSLSSTDPKKIDGLIHHLPFDRHYIQNILDYSTWANGQIGPVGDFNQNGDTTENYRVLGTDPWNDETVVWEARPDSVSGADGGWNTVYYPIDRTKLYRYSVWVNRTVTGNGNFYMGCRGGDAADANIGVLNRDTLGNNTNPYFWIGTPSQGVWTLVVAHIWPDGSGTGGNHPDSGRYTVDGRIGDITRDFVWRNDNLKGMHRSYLYYSTDTTTRQQWVYPRMEICDGNEPTIEDLLQSKDNILADVHSTLGHLEPTISGAMHNAANCGNIYNVKVATTLRSCRVDAGAAGNITIRLQKWSNGAVGDILAERTFPVTIGLNDLHLNMHINEPGEYILYRVEEFNLMRTDDLYTFDTSLSTTIDIVAGAVATASTTYQRYYYFFNLRIDSPVSMIPGEGIAIDQSTNNKFGTESNSSQDWSKWTHYTSSTYWDLNTVSQYYDSPWGMVFKGQNNGNSFIFEYTGNPFSYTSGLDYTASLYVWSNTTFSATFGATLGDSTNATISNTVTKTITITPTPQKISFTNTASATINNGRWRCSITSIEGTTQWFYFALPQLEEESFATVFTTYKRGSQALTINDGWLANESTIIFTNDIMVLDPNGSNQPILDTTTTDRPFYLFRLTTDVGHVTINNISVDSGILDWTHNQHKKYKFAVAYAADNVKVWRMDYDTKQLDKIIDEAISPTAYTTADMTIGCDQNYGRQTSQIFSNLLIYDHQLSTAEIEEEVADRFQIVSEDTITLGIDDSLFVFDPHKELFFPHMFNERQFNESFTTYVEASDAISISSTEIELQTGATPLIDSLALTLAEVTYINVVTSHTDNILLNVADVLVSIGLNVNDVSSIAITDTIITLENINNLDTTTITITEDSLAAYHAPVLVCDVEDEGIRWNWTKVA